MPYSIDRYSSNLFDAGFPINLVDNTIDSTSTSLLLIGRGIANYGEYIAESLIHITENFAGVSPPTSPITGQLWWEQDPTNPASQQKLQLWNGTIWKNISGSTSSAIPPTAPANGDFWFDTANSVLTYYNGVAWIAISDNINLPSASAIATSICADPVAKTTLNACLSHAVLSTGTSGTDSFGNLYSVGDVLLTDSSGTNFAQPVTKISLASSAGVDSFGDAYSINDNIITYPNGDIVQHNNATMVDNGDRTYTFTEATGTVTNIITNNSSLPIYPATGPANAYSVVNPTVTSYTLNDAYWVRPDTTNTGPATIDIQGVGPINIKKYDTLGVLQPLARNEFINGSEYLLHYDGSSFVIISSREPYAVMKTGTWTPTIINTYTGPTVGANPTLVGTWTAIGDIVTIYFKINCDDAVTPIILDDKMLLGGLPFVPTASPYTSAGTGAYESNFFLPNGGNAQCIVGVSNPAYLNIRVIYTFGTLKYNIDMRGHATYKAYIP